MLRSLFAAALVLAAIAGRAGEETIWLEAEHLHGIAGYCWPLGRPGLNETDGRWGLSGPGWAAEWNQGGESGFLSIATGPGDDQGRVAKDLDIPRAGDYHVWVRYADWREAPERFNLRLEQPDREPFEATFGAEPQIDEDNVMKLYYGWAFVWDQRPVHLEKGPATLSLLGAYADPVARQLDVIVLTTDAAYRPWIKERPASPAWALLDSWRNGLPTDLEPLARRRLPAELPPAWQPKTFRDKGFLYLWNVGRDSHERWLSDDPQRVPVPYNVADPEARTEFEQRFAGKSDVPIFGNPRLVPTFHGAGPAVFATDAEGHVGELGSRFAAWLDAHPERPWAMMMNYAPDRPIGAAGIALFARYRDRYVGSIAGENLGYFTIPPAEALAATESAASRRELAEAMSPLAMAANRAKHEAVFGTLPDGNPYETTIPCLSVGMPAFAPLISQWGARTIGYESSAITNGLLGMRWAFLRGIARQGGHLTATYRSSNFGDSATIFSGTTGYYPYPKNILDNYYSVYAGAGMTWYKFDLWYQYQAGASMFYHEQGFDEWWQPGGTSAAGRKPLQLSPKGKLVDRFLRLTAEPDFERGVPVTPIAFLVDYAHGWEPSPYWPNAFKNWHGHSDRWLYGDHEQMLAAWFGLAWHPLVPLSQQPVTALSEVYVPGVFGDVFDVIAAYPDTERWTTIDTYPAVVAIGEIPLTAAEGERLAKYVNDGGTLLLADAHLSGPGLAALGLPEAGEVLEANGYRWLGGAPELPSPRYRFRPITVPPEGRALAHSSDGHVIAASLDRGAGRLIWLSIPYGLTIGGQPSPVVAHLLGHLRAGLMPVEVDGDVEWSLNRTSQGWMVTLINPFGQPKPQQGIGPTDFRENRQVTIRPLSPIASATDRLLPTDNLTVTGNAVKLTVPAGAVRLIELR